MPDADLRALERRARAGDPEAKRRANRARRRTEARPKLTVLPWAPFPFHWPDYGVLERRMLIQGRQHGKTLYGLKALANELLAGDFLPSEPEPPPLDPKEEAANRLLGGLRRPLWWPAP